MDRDFTGFFVSHKDILSPTDSKSGFNQSMENFEKVSQMRGQMDNIMGRSGDAYERRESVADRFYDQAKSNVSSSESKRRF